MVLVLKSPESRKSPEDMGIQSICLVVKVQQLPLHKQSLQHMAQWGKSFLKEITEQPFPSNCFWITPKNRER